MYGYRLGYNIAQQGSYANYLKLFNAYKDRVESDSGEVVSDALTRSLYKMLEPTLDSIEFSWSGVAGSKLRTDGILDYHTKLYDISDNNNDATQTTATAQPHQVGTIAPNENPAMLNCNGEARYAEHDEISFAADEAWTVTVRLNTNFNELDRQYLYFSTTTGFNYRFGMAYSLSDRRSFVYLGNGGFVYFSDLTAFIGKNITITLTADGTGILSFYVNGVLESIQSPSTTTASSFSRIFREGLSDNFNGSISSHIIHSQALTPAQVLAEADFLQELYPPIPSVKIGSQDWQTSNFRAVATCLGTPIANVTENANVEKVVNGDFATDTDWDLGEGWSISGEQASRTTATSFSNLSQSNVFEIGKRYAISFDVLSISNGSIIVAGNQASFGQITTTGTKFGIIIATNTKLYIQATSSSTEVSIDNISVEEVGWAGSQDLYDGLIAQGETVYEATKAAAMWCYYNNDPEIGSWTGKSYNWFAVSLLQQDIDLYNAANPTEHWGWHVPSQAEFTTLQTELGGEAVAGGKMKKEGLDYWLTPNTGADNSSGFSAIGGGYRPSGFSALKVVAGLWHIGGGRALFRYNQSTFEINSSESKLFGHALKLIKDN